MIITAEQKMAEIIVANHHLLSIVNRFGIHLGFGEKSVQEVCDDYKINVTFFLEIANAFNNPDFFPMKNLSSFPLKLIIEYLYKAHDYYLSIKVPEIMYLISQLKENEKGKNAKAILLMQTFFNEYVAQLRDHIKREETVVYPYILDLERAFELNQPAHWERFRQQYNFTIDQYERDHEDIEEKIFDIKNLIIKYIDPQEQYISYFKLLGQLAHLEDDLNDHTEMENKVLIPRVRLMEKHLKA
jgi:regulator of cell morphogenesis and NO signaling